jgi:hypothetical protein
MRGTYSTRSVLSTLCLGLAVALAGCGGGGGGGKSGSSADPAAVVQSRSDAAHAAVVREDLEAYMVFISATYADTYGDTKPTLRDYMAALFEDFDIIKIEVVHRGYTVNSDKTVIVETLTQRWTDKIRETGNEATEDMQVTNEWVKEGDTWRLKSITEN